MARPTAPTPGAPLIFDAAVNQLDEATRASGRTWLISVWEEPTAKGKRLTGHVNEELLAQNPEALVAALDSQMLAVVGFRWTKHAPAPYVGLTTDARQAFLLTRLLGVYGGLLRTTAQRLAAAGVPGPEIEAAVQQALTGPEGLLA